MKQAMKQEHQNKFDILLHFMLQNWPCFTIASWFCNVNAWSNARKVVFHKARGKHAKKIKMAAQQEERLSEAVRKYPVLYDKADRYFKDKANKQLAWEDVTREANLENGKVHSKPKNYLKALGSTLDTNQTAQSYPFKINSFVD